MTKPCRELADEDCHWHSIGIGPMRIEKYQGAYSLWRRVVGHGDRFCGKFHVLDVAMRMAGILADVPDEQFVRWL